MDSKFCTGCQRELPPSEFYSKYKDSGGSCSRCKYCMAAYKQDHREQILLTRRAYRCRPEVKSKVVQQNKRSRLRKYGLSIEDYDSILESQGHLCAICGTSDPGDGRANFCVDHNHRTQKVRGLLCNPCNKALGLFKDNPSVMREAANYVERDGVM